MRFRTKALFGRPCSYLHGIFVRLGVVRGPPRGGFRQGNADGIVRADAFDCGALRADDKGVSADVHRKLSDRRGVHLYER